MNLYMYHTERVIYFYILVFENRYLQAREFMIEPLGSLLIFLFGGKLLYSNNLSCYSSLVTFNFLGLSNID